MVGYPLPGKSGSFQGLCSFNCNHGYCPNTVCGTTPNTGVVLSYSPFLPPACTGGSGSDAFQGLCDFGCHLGFCPMAVCKCTATGILVQTPAKTSESGTYPESDDHGLCKFACEHGYCPPVCAKLPTDNTCDGSNRMYSVEDVPLGEIERWSNDGQKLDHISGSGDQYVTIVNLTPYRMVHTSSPTPYQFTVWDFGDIPSGKARKNKAAYDLSSHVGSFSDTNGFANYRLEGTDKTFQVHVTSHMPDKYERRVVFDLGGMGMGWRELGFPGERVSVALVITGSEDFGYVNSLQLNNIAWMRSMYDIIKYRQLRHVVVPGSHDAAMSKISDSGWLGGGIPDNTETQSLDHYNQLRVGVRYFDMRIASIRGGDFWGAHVSGNTGASPMGSTGESLDDLILATNRFYTDYPGEVIVWVIKYMTDLNTDHASASARYWDADMVDKFYTQLERITNRCPPNMSNNTMFDKRPINEFLDANNGKGCVLLITDGNLLDGLPKDRPGSGIYHLNDYFQTDDYWPNKQTTSDNAPLQVDHMLGHKRDKGNTDAYTIMQWQVTPSAGDLISGLTLQLIANQESNPALYHYGVNKMTPDYFPTVILHDAVGLFHVKDLSFESYNPMMQTLVIGLNLYMVTQNCIVSSISNPLVAAKAKAKTLGGSPTTTLHSGFKTFSGVIFANGTVLDEAPPGFCRTCSYNDTDTIDHAANGTAVGRRRWTRGTLSRPVHVE